MTGRATCGSGTSSITFSRFLASGRRMSPACRGVGELRIAGQVGRDVAGPAALRLLQHPDGRADLPRRAVTALEGVVINERLLDRVQRLAGGQAVSRPDLGTVMRATASHCPAAVMNALASGRGPPADG